MHLLGCGAEVTGRDGSDKHIAWTSWFKQCTYSSQPYSVRRYQQHVIMLLYLCSGGNFNGLILDIYLLGMILSIAHCIQPALCDCVWGVPAV